MRSLLLFVHLAGVAVWVGGMFFAHLCLRPALETLAPPQRLVLMNDVMRRFLGWVGLAIVLLWASGLARMLAVGFGNAPRAWHAMMGIALVMTIVYAFIVASIYPKLRRAVAASEWPVAGAALGRIRRLVLVNLVLGFATIAVAASI